MAAKPLPPQGVLRQLLQYEPETGKLFWLRREAGSIHTNDLRGSLWATEAFNAKNAGKEAFTFADARGYRHGKVLGKTFQAHRIIWKLVHGYDPTQIDHKNGDPSDNRLINLRECTNRQNARNYAKGSSGTSVFRGVCWVVRDRKWAASINNDEGKRVSLGHYDDEISAAKVYDAAAIRFHGEFATLNFPAPPASEGADHG